MIHWSDMRSKTPPTIYEALAVATKQLQPKKITCPADRGLGDLEAEILLAHVLKKDRVWIRAHDERPLAKKDVKRFLELVSRRRRHEPIAYLVGEKEFYRLSLYVNDSVLIPRPSSETIVDLVIALKTNVKPLVLDVGTGSGAIAIAVAKQLPSARALGTDISNDALKIARKNAKRHRIKNLRFQKADLLSPALIKTIVREKGNRPLVIVVNLPYLPVSDKKKLAPDVVKYEPHGALFSGKDGLDAIRALLDQLAASDLKFHTAFIEFDPPQKSELIRMATRSFPSASVTIHKDLEGHARVLEVQSK